MNDLFDWIFIYVIAMLQRCNGYRTSDSQSRVCGFDFLPIQCYVMMTGHVFHTHAAVTEQYNLVLATAW